MILPDLYLFNPTCDFAVANGTVSWQPNRLLQSMESDLGNLPQYLCGPNDIVLALKPPSSGFLEMASRVGLNTPTFLTFAEGLVCRDMKQQALGKLMPWGWSPAAHHLLRPLKPRCSEEFKRSPTFDWNPELKPLFSRTTALNWLQTITEQFPDHCFISRMDLPVVCHSLLEIEKWTKIWGQTMLKSPWSSSGRGLLPINQFPVPRAGLQRATGMLRQQNFVMAEPLFRKVHDMGFLYQIEEGNVSFKGVSNFATTEKGAYLGNYLNYPLDCLQPDVKELINECEKELPALHKKLINEFVVWEEYQGPMGIDIMIYRDKLGKLKVNPCLEINWRHTMGFVSLGLQKNLSPVSSGFFGLWHHKKESFNDFASLHQKRLPLVLDSGKISSGFLPLTETSGEKHFGAYLVVWEENKGVTNLPSMQKQINFHGFL